VKAEVVALYEHGTEDSAVSIGKSVDDPEQFMEELLDTLTEDYAPADTQMGDGIKELTAKRSSMSTWDVFKQEEELMQYIEVMDRMIVDLNRYQSLMQDAPTWRVVAYLNDIEAAFGSKDTETGRKDTETGRKDRRRSFTQKLVAVASTGKDIEIQPSQLIRILAAKVEDAFKPVPSQEDLESVFRYIWLLQTELRVDLRNARRCSGAISNDGIYTQPSKQLAFCQRFTRRKLGRPTRWSKCTSQNQSGRNS